MLNIFKIKKALKQAKEHVEEVNRLNDELTQIGKEQNQIIDDQQARIEALQTQLESASMNTLEEIFTIDFEHYEGMTVSHESFFTSKKQAVDYLLNTGFKVDENSTDTYLNHSEQTLAFIAKRQNTRNNNPKE